jgi:hypothetical protein
MVTLLNKYNKCFVILMNLYKSLIYQRGGHSRGYPIDLLIDFLYGTVGRN